MPEKVIIKKVDFASVTLLTVGLVCGVVAAVIAFSLNLGWFSGLLIAPSAIAVWTSVGNLTTQTAEERTSE